MKPTIYCPYATCKNDKCSKKVPKHRIKEFMSEFMFTNKSPFFCFWNNSELVNNKPPCYK